MKGVGCRGLGVDTHTHTHTRVGCRVLGVGFRIEGLDIGDYAYCGSAFSLRVSVRVLYVRAHTQTQPDTDIDKQTQTQRQRDSETQRLSDTHLADVAAQ
jgi:hypothetical protein